MKKIDYKKILLDYTSVIMGCFILAFAITSILKPNGLMTGGITGLAILLERFFKVSYTYFYYSLTFLIFLSAWFFLGKREMLKIAFVSVAFPVILAIMERVNYEFIQDDMILGTVYFGILGGVGVGLIFKRGYAMGGTGAIAKILHRRFLPFMSLSQIILLLDSAIILLSLTIFETNIALYAIITQIVFTKAIDMVLFGFGSKKVKIEIISDMNQAIESFIIHEVKRGISAYEIVGGYTNETKRKIVSICSPHETMLIRQYIASIDPNAFVNVLPVISVWGKGVGFNPIIEDGQ